MMVLIVSKRSILWSWERILSAGGGEILQPQKVSFKQSYDMHIWVELQRWMSPALQRKFYWSDVRNVNTPKWKRQSMTEHDGINN